MAEYFAEFVNVLIPYIANFTLTLIPMWKTRDVKTRSVYLFVLGFLIYISAGLLLIRQFRAMDLRILQLYKLVASVPLMVMPYLFFRKRVGQNTFLLFVTAMYNSVAVGTGISASENWFAGSANSLIIADIASLLVIAVTLPPLLFFLRRLCENQNVRHMTIWRFIWLLPATYFAMFLLGGSILSVESFRGNGPLILRALIYFALLLTCFMVESSLRQVAENVMLKERARMIEGQLDLQREQYKRFAKNAEAEKAARHDARHHLAVMMDLNMANEREKLGVYLAELSGAVPTQTDERYCDNYAANIVAAHYLGMAENEGIAVDAKLIIPENTGSVPAIDLCVVIGNLLENALEATRGVKDESAYIRARSRVDGDALSIVVENSFDGQWHESGGAYLSRKEIGAFREGVGLSSVRMVCEKHSGLAKIERLGNVWRASALMEMRDVRPG